MSTKEHDKLYARQYRKRYPWKRCYHALKQRCTNIKCDHYPWYGGKGIEALITIEEIEKLWFRDKAYLMKCPSIDRKNKKEHYTFDNCQFIENDLNRIKDRNKPILQFDLEGHYIQEWDSSIDIELELGIDNSSISKCCRGKLKSSGGFKWSYNER